MGITACGAFAIFRFGVGRRLAAPDPSTEKRAVTCANYSPFQHIILSELEREKKAGIVYRDEYFDTGDPPPGVGVCTDVVIRSFREAGVDLQKLVQKDIASSPGAYKIEAADPKIDYRRCRNLIVYFKRNAITLPTTGREADWKLGDVVFWDTHGDGRVDHVGLIAAGRDADGNPTIVHHWPGRPVEEAEALIRFKVRGHFRWKTAI
jgi:uncharacterized protein YijF (DUF1287 family)